MAQDGRVRRWVRIFIPEPRAEVSEELQFHFEQRVRDNIARGMDPVAAREAARTRLGDLAAVSEECAQLLVAERRASARRVWLRLSWLDFKLGFRMLVKYPGLAIIGGFGIAIAIAIGSGYTVFLNALTNTSVPLPQGDRLVALQNWDTRVNERNPQSLHDFVAWREELRSVQDVSAFRAVSRNLIMGDGSSEPLMIAEMSAAGFRVAGVQPLLGRYLNDDDEHAGAAPVVVIGYDLWQRRFAGDSGILGRGVRFGSTVHTVVGVMPEGFAFPVNHEIWMPFRADPSAYARGEGPSLTVFGRLAPGKKLPDARAEMRVIGERASGAYPQTHARLRAQAQPYTYTFSGMDNPGDVAGARAARILLTLLMIVICVNVAAVVYARTAVRRGEIVVRTALGASRARVVAQLFAEALVMTLLAAGAGLALVAFGLQKARWVVASMFEGKLPFWFDLRLSPGAVLYGLALAVLAAVIVGMLPALKATGRKLQTSLQQLSSGGSELLLGKTWTLLIVGQVTVTVALLPPALFEGKEVLKYGTADAGFADDEYVASFVQMEHDWEPWPALDARQFQHLYGARIDELARRLRSELGVSDVTYASSVPGSEAYALVEIEGGRPVVSPKGEQQSGPHRAGVRFARVDVGYFGAFEVPILAGRAFTRGDAAPSGDAAIVNESFVQRVFKEGNAIGRRFRYVHETGEEVVVEQRSYEIVGVVPDFPNALMPEQIEAKVYHASTAAESYPVLLAVRLRGEEAQNFGPRLRKVASTVDPALQLQRIRTMDDINGQNQSALRLLGLGIGLATVSVLLLSAAGIYAMMSLAVARRRREIGIRAALGANPRRLLASIFARALVQIGLGMSVGFLGFLAAFRLSGGHAGAIVPLLVIVILVLATVGMSASLGPARRALQIQPTEALRHE